MLICLVLCAAAVLPTAFSDRPEAQNVQPHPGRNSEMARRLAASYAAARNQGLLRLQKYGEGQPPDEVVPYLLDAFVSLWSRKPYSLYSAVGQDSESDLDRRNALLSRSLDQIGGGHLLRREAVLNPLIDEIGGGHLLRRDVLDQLRGSYLDTIGGRLMLKRGDGFRALDPIGGGHLLKRDGLDSIGGGNLLKRQLLDSIGGGNLLKRQSLDSIGGGHLLKREDQQRRGEEMAEGKLGSSDTNSEAAVSKKNFDEIDNAGFKDYLYKRNFDEIDSAGFRDDLSKRNFDEIDNAGFQDYLYKRNFDEIDNAGFRDYLLKRNFDEIDNAGFRDYLYKRTFQDLYLPEVRNERVVCTAEGCWSRKLLPATLRRYQRDL